MPAFQSTTGRLQKLRLGLAACLTLLIVLHSSRPAAADDGLAILPAEFTLTGATARQRVLVETFADGVAAGQVAEGVVLESSDEGVVRIEDGLAVAVGDGTATITARVGDRQAAARVTVVDYNRPQSWNFQTHVRSVFSKTGCNSGACHGAAAGKGGFRLSLRGYDPEADFLAITRQSRGRRIVPSDPGRSLILTKPTGAVPHKGGLRFSVDSFDYRVISEWIANGHPGPSDDDPQLERLEILPKQSRLQPGTTQDLIVRAYFSDGHAEDVTHWAKFTSTNQSVAQVDEAGRITVMGHGEGAIVAWFLSTNVVAGVTVPYETEIPQETFARAERNNLIDEIVLEKLQALNIPPSPLTTDGEFLRRAYLDTIGILPTAEETRAFLNDQSPDKRERLIDYLLTRPEFVDYWTYKWSDLLLVTGARLRPDALKAYSGWIRERVANNTPWDEFARGIVTAQGSTFENGAANFYSLHQDPLDMAETVSMAFLGMSINCARCHDHPLEKWTNDDYFGMANLFARVRGKGWGGDFRSGDGNRVIFTAAEGELIQPRTGRPQLPRPLDGEPLPFDSEIDRREHLANWLTAAENPYFSRAIVNRVWANFLGVGLVENVDDLRLTNPASNPALLDALANYLVANGYDLKALMRLIVQSSTYQRSSRPLPGNEADERFYSRYYPKRLKAELLLDALSQATGVATSFKDYPPGTRALQLPDAEIESYFLQTFGRPERIITCECERSDEPSMVQVLHIMNGDTLNDKLAAEDNHIGKLLAAETPDEQIIEHAYLSGLARFPTPEEQAQILAVLKDTKANEKRPAIEDLYWSILSSKEFLFNH